MPIQPKPYKLICKKCGYFKIVKHKSDVYDIVSSICPKCKSKMKKVTVNILDILINQGEIQWVDNQALTIWYKNSRIMTIMK